MKKVLVLSTDAQLLAFLDSELSDKNLAVSVLQNPDDLQNALYSIAPDALIVDFYLNDINGGAICHQLKSDNKTHHLPIVMLTDEPQIARFSNKFGCDVLLSKSAQLHQIAYALHILTEKQAVA